MTNSVLEKDSEMKFPKFTVLTASAGSGKTHTLAQRFVQFILSERTPFNDLHNMLAVTFSNNAAKEMKDRILLRLKKICLGDSETVGELGELLSLDKASLERRAEAIIEEILSYYEDFHVKTIDSFMASIFKASAVDFGFNPDFDIILTSGPLIEYAFDLYLKRVKPGSHEFRMIERVITIIEENRRSDEPFLWNPRDNILSEIKQIHRELMATGKRVVTDDVGDMVALKRKLEEHLLDLESEIEHSDLTRSRASSYSTIISAVKGGRFGELAGKACKNPPVNKPKAPQDRAAYDHICLLWDNFARLVNLFTRVYARTYYLPYLKMHEEIQEILEKLKRQEAAVFLEDMNRSLSDYLTSDMIPDVYLRLGDSIYHYLIDEFQDTSPVQWANLSPLMENALSQGGSLFIVGDTKQAIYGFRNADYAIMKGLERQNPFPSAALEIRELDVNYRSLGEVVRFTEGVFSDAIDGNHAYCEAASRSGLLGCKQSVRDENENRGYVECALYEADEEHAVEQAKIRDLMGSLKDRDYSYRDITILAMRNEDVIRIASWLNDDGIPFISYSSLDVRNRRVTGEILALLRFLDSPLDDLSFGTFLLGETLKRALVLQCKEGQLSRIEEICHRNSILGERPLYKALQEEMPALWNGYFEELFKLSGYLPLYDLAVVIYRTFDVWRTFKDDDEASLTKILEAIKEFENDGKNSMREFLESADSEEETESDWNVQVPHDVDAVRIMTVHKAKGLGFPVVILLLYEEKNRGFKYVLEDTEDGVRVLRLNKEIAASNPSLGTIYSEKESRFLIDRLNSLYVAFTRAAAELYVVGVRRKERYPFDLLSPYANSCLGQKGQAEVRNNPATSCTPTLHGPALFSVAAPAEAGPLLPGLNVEEKERGELLHKVLSSIDFVDEGVEAGIDAALRQYGRATAADMRDVILAALVSKDLSEYFTSKPGRTIKTEQEYIDRRGHLVRMDRVVIDEEMVTVIDFKTGVGTGLDAINRSQVRNYMRIIKDVYPGRSVQGLIAYLDHRAVERVESWSDQELQ
jgi:ATP-dependent exoDNAse (exonuclease V) beta subunit